MLLYELVPLYTKRVWYIQITIVTLFFQCSLYTKSACIIIHGTWGKNSSWHRPIGDFFKAVNSCNQELKCVDEVISFLWSGKLGHPAQLTAAYELVNIISEHDFVILIAHSHGATVGMICSGILAENDSYGNNLGKIAKFYALGVPVKESVVAPNMLIIKKFYNLFSFGDFIQTVNGAYDRVFAEQKGIFNLSLKLFGVHPSHEQLHHPIIGAQLLKIEEYFLEKNIGNFEQCCSYQPGCISFFEYKLPMYEIQDNQEQLLKIDQQIYKLAEFAFFRGLNRFDDTERL